MKLGISPNLLSEFAAVHESGYGRFCCRSRQIWLRGSGLGFFETFSYYAPLGSGITYQLY
jgi:hypothetical protein